MNDFCCRRGKKQFNVSHPPLFPGIPLKNVVIDNLHLFLRVSDVLINLLVVELKRQDGIERVKKMTASIQNISAILMLFKYLLRA